MVREEVVRSLLYIFCHSESIFCRECCYLLSQGGGSFRSQFPELLQRDWRLNTKVQQVLADTSCPNFAEYFGETTGLSKAKRAGRVGIGSRCFDVAK